MPAGTYDKFTIEQGATFSHTLTWKDSSGDAIDLTGYTARMKVRGDTDTGTEIIEMTTENGGITLGGVAGTVALLMTAVETAAMDFTTGVYDLELVSGVLVTRLLQGKIKFDANVTV